jgi:hypothetical protein
MTLQSSLFPWDAASLRNKSRRERVSQVSARTWQPKKTLELMFPQFLYERLTRKEVRQR